MSEKLTERRKLLTVFLGLGAGLVLKPFARAQTCLPTLPDVKGPFYTPGAPHRTVLVNPDEKGDRLTVTGSVLSDDCRTPLANALLDIWQADTNGIYHYEKDNYRLRGQLLTDKMGQFEFKTIVPGRYKLGASYRPAHIHFTISHPNYETLTTQLYFKGDPYLAPNDACGEGCNSRDPGRIVDLKKNEAKANRQEFSATFPIILKRVGKGA